jgi:DNA modification methylase
MIGQVVQIGGVTLIHGDMREVLPHLDERAALVLTDPPYRLDSGGCTSKLRGIFASDRYSNNGQLFDIVDWPDLAHLIWAAARDDADAIVMANDRNLCRAQAALETAGFRFHRLLVWDKRTVTPNRWFMSGLEFGLYMWRGRARPINDASAHQMMRVAQVDVTAHPTEKPVALFRRWIELTTAPGDLVLDPFFGSGCAAVAALQSGRRFVGVEKDRRWFEATVARVQAEAAGGQMDFGLSGVGR